MLQRMNHFPSYFFTLLFPSRNNIRDTFTNDQDVILKVDQRALQSHVFFIPL